MSADCILWTGCFDHGTGYGRLGRRLAHRVAYEEAYGQIPRGLEIHHTCEVRACVNPAHLIAVTRREHKRLHCRTTHCRRGHRFTSENTYVRPTGQLTCRACARERAVRYRKARAK